MSWLHISTPVIFLTPAHHPSTGASGLLQATLGPFVKPQDCWRVSQLEAAVLRTAMSIFHPEARC
jgi:hypothetical protein